MTISEIDEIDEHANIDIQTDRQRYTNRESKQTNRQTEIYKQINRNRRTDKQKYIQTDKQKWTNRHIYMYKLTN